MKGCLIVNAFLKLAKFDELYDMFSKAFQKKKIELDLLTNTQAMSLTFLNQVVYDFVLFWDKDVYLCECLEKKGYRTFNSSKAIGICDDKAKTYLSLVNSNIKQPKTITAPLFFKKYDNYDFVDTAADFLSYPFIIKENFGSFGKQVYLVSNRCEAIAQIDEIGNRPFLFQEFVSSSFGRDIRAQVVGGAVVAAVQRTASIGNFITNAANGGTMQSVVLTKEQHDFALRVCQLLKLDFAGVDILLGQNNEPILCEVNSNAHFKNLLDATGINVADYIVEHIINTTTKG